MKPPALYFALGGIGLVLLLGFALLAIIRRRREAAQRLPVRTELEVLPADEPGRRPLGFAMSEQVGIGVANLRGVTRTSISTTDRPPLARTRAPKKQAKKAPKKPEAQKPKRTRRARRTRFDRLDDDD